MAERFVLVLAGGLGERFWPWSRPDRPKQLLPLARGGRSLLASTLERALALAPPERVVVVTARRLAAAVRRECGGSGVRVLGEPVARNTAAAIGAAAVLFEGEARGASFAVLPADHAIDDTSAFAADLACAYDVAEREAVLVTFGIRPRAPETGFGYIRRGAPLAERLSRVARFTEKPDRDIAEQWLASGEYLWNAGSRTTSGATCCSATPSPWIASAASWSGTVGPPPRWGSGIWWWCMPMERR